ncbi:GntP family permease [Planctomyces sp. SH-PL62]|uniref:GntP family permease n=1 Tax=Planctomyces sp. SH-PL62 TaxID=1636152 RepID=UPI00078CB906|nr:GntP family permease [Planctomyces sp. SH-PL62]AMV41005.1 fructuronate transporter [Planctomyces sp. SH-PL62]
MAIEVGAIALALGLLMTVAYRGLSVIVFAPLCALLAAALSGLPLLPSYTDLFMTGVAGFIRSFFPLFLLGAVFGKLMDASGAAAAIAAAMVRALGPRHAIPAVVLAGAVLTYGGVSLFVVAFAVYPLGAALFRDAGIPKRLLPAAIALGAFTFTMDALPGTPQVQNIIPTRFFKTDAYAAPVVGLIGGASVLLGGLFWLDRRRAWAVAAGEGYGDGHLHEPEARTGDELPSIVAAVLPLILVLAVNFALSRTAWSIDGWYPESSLRETFPATNPREAAPSWAVIVALSVGILATLALHARRMRVGFSASLSTATAGALLAIFNTASEVGFGTVVKSLPGFGVVRGWVLDVSRNVLVSEAVAVNALAGITGSASGGLSIALEVMGGYYLEAAHAQGISPELLHRIASMASGGMDTLPHNGAVITLLAITGLTHRQSYPDIFAITVIKTAVVFALALSAGSLPG